MYIKSILSGSPISTGQSDDAGTYFCGDRLYWQAILLSQKLKCVCQHNRKQTLFWSHETHPVYIHYSITIQRLDALSWTNGLFVNPKQFCANHPHLLSQSAQTHCFHDKSVCTSARPSPSPYSLSPPIQAPTQPTSPSFSPRLI